MREGDIHQYRYYIPNGLSGYSMAEQDTRYFEDMEVGEEVDCGSIEVTKEEMLEFAERYDPQPFHVDEKAAQETMYGDLIASG